MTLSDPTIRSVCSCALGLGLALLAGCDEHAYRLVLTYPDQVAYDRAASVDVYVYEGDDCDALAQARLTPRLSFDAHTDPPTLGEVGVGTTAFSAAVRDASCARFLGGCVEEQLTAQTDRTVRIYLRGIQEVGCAAGERCSAGRCLPGDAGALLDAALQDSATIDGAQADAASADRGQLDTSTTRDSSAVDVSSTADASSAPDVSTAADTSSRPDLSTPDLSMPDLSTPDLSAGQDAGAPQVISAGPDLHLEIPDGGYRGTLASMACVALELADLGPAAVAQVRVTVGIDHPFLGDLVIKVEDPGGLVSTVLSRPGIDEPVDDEYTTNGDNSDLSASHPITFRDDSVNDAELMADSIGPDEVACRDDGVCDFAPNPGAGPGTNLSDFNGRSPVGTWRVCVGDGYSGDPGWLESVTLLVSST